MKNETKQNEQTKVQETILSDCNENSQKKSTSLNNARRLPPIDPNNRNDIRYVRALRKQGDTSTWMWSPTHHPVEQAQ